MLILFAISAWLLVHFYSSPAQVNPAEFNRESLFAFSIAFAEWIVLSTIAGFTVFRLYAAALRTVAFPQNAKPWMPVYSTAAFSLIVFTARFIGWVPIELGALGALPFILLPPLTYRVTLLHSRASTPLFTMEETCRVLDAAKASSLIREFLERYPLTKVYLYRNTQAHSTGGLLFHNRERLFVPSTTHLEVTLNCPFTTRLGVFAEGRETFRAYLNRDKSEGCVIHNLPHQHWEEWLTGLTKKEWFERIGDLDEEPVNHPNTGGLPCQFQEYSWSWQAIELT